MAYSFHVTFDGDDTYYVPVGVTGRVVNVVTCVNEQAIDAETTLTLTGGSAGTTAIGVVTIANLAAEGTVDKIVLDTTTLGKVEVGPDLPIKAVLAGGSTNVEVQAMFVIDEFHGSV